MRQFWDAARSPLICNKSTAIPVRLTGSIGKFFRFSFHIFSFFVFAVSLPATTGKRKTLYISTKKEKTCCCLTSRGFRSQQSFHLARTKYFDTMQPFALKTSETVRNHPKLSERVRTSPTEYVLNIKIECST